MNAWARRQGYTIVEVLIVLAVTSALLASAMYFFNGRSGRLAFENDITAFQTKLDDIINNVASGYYASTSNFTCTSSSSGPSISTGSSSARGTNAACQFLGRGVHLNTNFTNYYYVHNIIGLRQVAGGTNLVTSLTEAQPKLLSDGSTSTVETAEKVAFNSSELVHTRATTTTGATYTDRGFLGFISSFPTITAGNTDPGAQSVGLYTVYNSVATSTIDISQSKNTVVDWFNATFDATKVISINKFEICFKSLGSGQYGIVTVGQDNSETNITQSIAYGSCPSW